MPQAGLLSIVLFRLLVSVPGEPQHEGRKVDNTFHEGGDEADPHQVDWDDKKATSNHLVHSNKWGRDPEVLILFTFISYHLPVKLYES